MEWILLALAAGGAGVLGRRLVGRRQERRQSSEDLAVARRLAEEDVVVFGEQLQGLDEQVGSSHLDSEGRVDYQRALDAYETVQRTFDRLTHADEISKVADNLATGRYALACVQARVEGRPLPELRSPCFFNPQHGPSVTDVVWTSPVHGTRTVPACAQDAARVAAREQPDLRFVEYGASKVPYWEAGVASNPYTSGYFASGLAAGMRSNQSMGGGTGGGF